VIKENRVVESLKGASLFGFPIQVGSLVILIFQEVILLKQMEQLEFEEYLKQKEQNHFKNRKGRVIEIN
jgi:hypothetical protein